LVFFVIDWVSSPTDKVEWYVLTSEKAISQCASEVVIISFTMILTTDNVFIYDMLGLISLC